MPVDCFEPFLHRGIHIHHRGRGVFVSQLHLYCGNGSARSDQVRGEGVSSEAGVIQLARVLWGTNLPGASRSWEVMRRVIEEEPILQSMVGEDFRALGDIELELRLRERTDPFEFRVGAWATKLRYLAKWLEIEQSLGRKLRAFSVKLREREQKIITFLGYGYSHQQMADRLGVSTKTVQRYRGKV